jgi:hypothetical protein
MESKQILEIAFISLILRRFFDLLPNRILVSKNKRCVESIKKYKTNDNRIKDIYSELSENK